MTELALVSSAGGTLTAVIAAVPHIAAIRPVFWRVGMTATAGTPSGGVPGRRAPAGVAKDGHCIERRFSGSIREVVAE